MTYRLWARIHTGRRGPSRVHFAATEYANPCGRGFPTGLFENGKTDRNPRRSGLNMPIKVFGRSSRSTNLRAALMMQNQIHRAQQIDRRAWDAWRGSGRSRRLLRFGRLPFIFDTDFAARGATDHGVRSLGEARSDGAAFRAAGAVAHMNEYVRLSPEGKQQPRRGISRRCIRGARPVPVPVPSSPRLR
jgi:hypothetical protein